MACMHRLLRSFALRWMTFKVRRSSLQVVLEPLIDWNFHRLAEFDELHNIQSSLTSLDLGHEGLSVPKTLGQLNLRESTLLPDFP